MKVCHISSVHDYDDVRIFVKECSTLAKNGYDTYFVVNGDSKTINGVKIIGLGKPPKSRIKRLLSFSKKAYKVAKSLDCDVYHFHDPELLKYGKKLAKQGKKVIFDSHEDVPAQILDKTYIPKFLRKMVAKRYQRIENDVVKHLYAVVTATSYIANKFKGRANIVVDINNYPKLDDILFSDRPVSERQAQACYAGGIDDLRGKTIMIKAFEEMEGKLVLAGYNIDNEDFTKYKNVSFVGTLDRKGVNDLYADSLVGLCILMPANNYVNSKPIKLYEYMGAGIPFVCSDFPLWKELADETNAGFCVDVNDIDAIREVISRLINDRKLAETMGKNGRKFILEKYNWDIEGAKLLKLYKGIEEQLEKESHENC